MAKPGSYAISEVDGADASIAAMLVELHAECFSASTPAIEPAEGWWWIAWVGEEPAAFAGMRRAANTPGTIYMSRAGVLPAHCGHKLQLRMIRLREAKARRLGFTRAISDTTDNIASSNNLILAGSHLFRPAYRWGFERSLYWQKDLT